jgi:outer membrane protein assembly factor BamB
MPASLTQRAAARRSCPSQQHPLRLAWNARQGKQEEGSEERWSEAACAARPEPRWLQLFLPMLVCCLASHAMCQAQGTWPQFRGPGGRARPDVEAPLPDQIGPHANVLWKVKLPPGHSSPIVLGDRIYLTAVQGEKLLTLALNRADGQVVWQAEAPYEKLEAIHAIGSHAQPTPATDGDRVVSMFGSSGLLCYDREGRLLWHRKMGPFNNDFGAGTSPVIVGDLVLLVQDHDTGSFLLAANKHTGETVWQTDRSEFPRNYCSPLIWQTPQAPQVVVAATLRVVGYDLATGRELWTVRGLSRAVCMTPVVGDDGTLYVAGWAAGGDSDARIVIEPFADARRHDANLNGTLEESELPEGPVKMRFTQFDRNKDGQITEEEYEWYRGVFDRARNVILAIQPGGEGDVTESHVRWEFDRYVPFCASPVYYGGLLFTVKDGGIFQALDGASGVAGKRGRVAAAEYYASPVAGDGKVYLVNVRGEVTVATAEAEWKVLATAELGEDVYATPALVDGCIYLRTVGHLYCFGLKP